MADVVTTQERELIDAALRRIPPSARRVPTGKSGLPEIFWDGQDLKVRGLVKGWRGMRFMGAKGGKRAGEIASLACASRNARICADVRGGMTYPQLVAKYSLAAPTIYEIATREGLSVTAVPRNQDAANRKTALIVSLVDGVRTVSEIARLADCSARAVRDRRDRLGLDIPKGKAGRPSTAQRSAA